MGCLSQLKGWVRARVVRNAEPPPGCATIMVTLTHLGVYPKEACMHPSTDDTRMEQLVTTMSEHMATLTRTLGTWVQEGTHDLQAIEEQVLRLVKDLGATLVAGVCTLLASVQPPRTV